MSDNEDLLGDDLGDHSLTDYNLGNEEEEQLLADDYDLASQNVPTSVGPYIDSVDMVSTEFPSRSMTYNQPMQFHTAHTPSIAETECIVPNISVEVPNPPLPDHSTYIPYKPPTYEPELAVVPAPIPAAPIESPQIVPSEMTEPTTNGDRERFVTERPPGAQRTPQVRNIPDSLDKVYVPRGAFGGRGRNTWRAHPHHQHHQHHPHHQHPYRRNNMHRVNFGPRPAFPPPARGAPPPGRPEPFPAVRPEPRLEIAPDLPIPVMRPDIHDIGPDLRPDARPEIHLEMRPDIHLDVRPGINELRLDPHPPHPGPRQGIRPELPPGGRPDLPPQMASDRPMLADAFGVDGRLPFPRFPFRPPAEERQFPPRGFEPRPVPAQAPPPVPLPFQPSFPRFGPPDGHLRVTVRQEQEVRMLPVLPPNLPPGGLAGKKVLINPHFKGNFQAPIEGLPAYIPTRIHKSPPPSPTLEIKFGPIKDIDDAAERFIAEQRTALARAATRKFARRSPQRYVENTTIEIENELARRSEDDELLRRQEEFISANRAGLRRRMRSPTPPRRSPSPSPRRSPERRPERLERPERVERRAPPSDEDTEYRRRLREQESLRERVLRAKEVRRRKNAVLLQKQIQEREREREDRECHPPEPQEPEQKPELEPELAKDDSRPTSTLPEVPRPDTTRKSPERPPRKPVGRERSPPPDESEVNSTCETLTPPRGRSPERALTPPLPPPPPAPPRQRIDSDDELDLILDDIDGILSDDDDKDKEKPVEPPKPPADLRAKLPPRPERPEAKRPPRQKITFGGVRGTDERKKKEKSPIRRTIVTSSGKAGAAGGAEPTDRRPTEAAAAGGAAGGSAGSAGRARPRIMFGDKQIEKDKIQEAEDKPQPFPNRRVVLHKKGAGDGAGGRVVRAADPQHHQPAAGIFTRAVRTALGAGVRGGATRVEYSDDDEDALLQDESAATVAAVANLPHGMTDTRLKTLAGSDVQSLELNREGRSARIAFRSAPAAAAFRRKFHNKMVAASRLNVTLC